MIQSDALSRQPDLCPEEEPQTATVLPETLFINTITSNDYFINLIDTSLQHWISSSTQLDPEASNALKTLVEQGPQAMKGDLENWTLEEHDGNRLLFYKEKNYVPNDPELRRAIVKRHHDSMTIGLVCGPTSSGTRLN